MAKKINVDILANSSRASREVSSFTNKAESQFKGLAKVIASAFAFKQIADGFKRIVNAASNLEEVSSKFNTVFEGQIALASKFEKQLVSSYNLSTRAARQYLSSIQDLLVPMGVSANQAAQLSGEVVKLAADLGSFNNLPTAKVMEDIQSALVGNFETMKKYGVVLNETVVKQEAYNSGIAKAGESLTAAQKAQAAYNLIVQGSQAALGDVSRTSNSFANQWKRLVAITENFSAALGTKLLPKITPVIQKLGDWIKANQDLIATNFGKFIDSTAKALELLYNNIELVGTAIATFLGIKLIASLSASLAGTLALSKATRSAAGTTAELTAAIAANTLALRAQAGAASASSVAFLQYARGQISAARAAQLMTGATATAGATVGKTTSLIGAFSSRLVALSGILTTVILYTVAMKEAIEALDKTIEKDPVTVLDQRISIIKENIDDLEQRIANPSKFDKINNLFGKYERQLRDLKTLLEDLEGRKLDILGGIDVDEEIRQLKDTNDAIQNIGDSLRDLPDDFTGLEAFNRDIGFAGLTAFGREESDSTRDQKTQTSNAILEQIKFLEQFKDIQKDALKTIRQDQMNEFEKRLDDLKEYYEGLIKLATKNGQDTTDLLKAYAIKKGYIEAEQQQAILQREFEINQKRIELQIQFWEKSEYVAYASLIRIRNTFDLLLKAYPELTNQIEQLRQVEIDKIIDPLIKEKKLNEFFDQLEEKTKQFGVTIDRTTQEFEFLTIKVKEIGSAFTENFIDAFQYFIDGTLNAKDAFSLFMDSVLRDLSRLFISKAFEGLFGLFGQLGTSGGAGGLSQLLGIAGTLFGGGSVGPYIPALADGGTAMAGRPYLVGENGPELFIPGQTGTVAPNTGKTVNVSNNITINKPGNAAEANQYGAILGRQIKEQVRQAMADEMRYGGVLNKQSARLG